MEKTHSLITAHWSNIAVMNFPVDPQSLVKYLPNRLELAPFENTHFLSLVAFKFKNTRMGLLPVPFYGDFIELYLGFFAQRKVNDENRRGWVFIRKIVPSAVVAVMGRTLYREDYIKRPMRAVVEPAVEVSTKYYSVRYEWKNSGRWNSLLVRSSDIKPHFPEPGTIEHYVTENYGGFSKRNGGRGIEFPAEHPEWSIWTADRAQLDCDVEDIYGSEFSESLGSSPHSAFLASGSRVTLGKATQF